MSTMQPTQPTPDRLVFRDEFCELAKVSSETVRRWVRDGRLPGFDWMPSRKRQAWKRSTLCAAGHFVPELLVKPV